MDFAVTVGGDASCFFLFSFTYQSARKQRSNRVRSLNVISQPASSPGHPPPGRVRAQLPSMRGARRGRGGGERRAAAGGAAGRTPTKLTRQRWGQKKNGPQPPPPPPPPWGGTPHRRQ